MKKALLLPLLVIGVHLVAQVNHINEYEFVGIGTTTPYYPLEVGGTSSGSGVILSTGVDGLIGWKDRSLTWPNFWCWYATGGTTALYDGLHNINRFSVASSGKITAYSPTNSVFSIDANGTGGNTATLELNAWNARLGGSAAKIVSTDDSDYSADLRFFTADPSWGPGAGSVPAVERMRITPEGNIGIGTYNTGSYKLAVEGKLGARKIVVTQAPVWADYVFDKNYKLPSLKEIEKYICVNQHLQGVPSAREIETNGIDLGDNQALLLKKIEELTLYVISQNKKQEKLNSVIVSQGSKIKKLEKLIRKN